MGPDEVLVELGMCEVADEDAVVGVVVSNTTVDVLDRSGGELMLRGVLMPPLIPELVGVSGK